MLDATIPQDQRNLCVTPESVELVLTDDDASPLSLVLSPFEDLAEMKSLKGKNFSLKDYARGHAKKLEDLFSLELHSLQGKSNQFRNSPTYHNRLANLAFAAGKTDLEGTYLRGLSEISNDSYFAHKNGEYLISLHNYLEAENIFKSLDLSNDVQANLRLAYFHMQRQDIASASAQVSKAVDIDPLDFGARLFEGALRLLDGRYEKAVLSFRIASETRPASASVHCNMAIAYIAMKMPEKALASLRRSVALNPLNSNAIILLSDLAFKENKNEDAVPSLRYYLQFEQTSSAIWARLARALLELNKTDESIAALKRQGSLFNDGSVWNNLGVAYYKKGDNKKALESFKHSMIVSMDKSGRDFYLAAKNLALILEQRDSADELLAFTEMVIGSSEVGTSLTEREFADLVMLRIHALFRLERPELAVSAAENILNSETSSSVLQLWAAIALLSWYPINQQYDRALYLAEKFSLKINEFSERDSHLRIQLINNISFVFAETGNVKEAEDMLSLITNKIHIENYPTATLGLINIKKGNFDRASELYEEAIRISMRASDKARIKQKYYLEIGKYLTEKDPRKAVRNFVKASEIKGGENGLLIQAKKFLKALN